MSPFRRLLGYADRYRRDFLVGLVCVVVTTAVALAAPMVLRFAIDDLTRGVTGAKLFEYGALLLAIGVIGGVFRFLMRRVLIGTSRQIEYDMRNDFFAHLQKLPASYFQTHRTGDLMSRATNDLNAVRMMIGPSVMYSTNTLLVFVVAIGVMCSIDARLTGLALIPLPFVSICVKGFGSAIHRRFEQIQAQLSEISAVVQESLSGVRVVRAYGQEQHELERFRGANEEYVRRNRRLIALQGLFFPSMSFFLGLGALLSLWFGSRAVINKEITLGQFVAFNYYLTMLSWPVIAFGWVTNMLQRGMASWKRMLEVLDTEPAIRDTVRLKADTTYEVGAGHEAGADAVRLKPDTTYEVGAGHEAGADAVRLKPDTTYEVGVRHEAGADAVRLKPDTTYEVGVRHEAGADAVRLKPDTTYEVGVRHEADTTHDGDASYVVSGFSRTRAVRGQIEFRDLVFSYGGRPVLDHVSVQIAAGETIAIVGVTGSGKSTLMNLLARLHEPPAGTIFVDGIDIRDMPLALLRGAIGFVPQEPFLFSDTLADNVAFGLDAVLGTEEAGGAGGADQAGGAGGAGQAGQAGGAGRERLERIYHAAAIARLDKDVADFPKGYETLVGERGITLSGGQKQRTAIARAVAIDPAILILDDALSAVDTYTEEEILARLRTVMRERTSLIVSHRISTVREADRILVLDGGRLVERGTHDELIRYNGLYATLYRKQLLEEELAAS